MAKRFSGIRFKKARNSPERVDDLPVFTVFVFNHLKADNPSADVIGVSMPYLKVMGGMVALRKDSNLRGMFYRVDDSSGYETSEILGIMETH